jgi:putative toxin-antitoxin system antitoxin component (TIGR02293 family)
MEAVAEMARILGIQGSAAERARGAPLAPMRLIERIEAGLPLQALDRLTDFLAPGDAAFKYTLVPKATLNRRTAQKRLSPEESERLARLARVGAMARDVWKTDAAARAFLFRPHPMLEGRRPVDVARATDLGAQLVEGILGRLKYGSAA